jgi:hypothetical protein
MPEKFKLGHYPTSSIEGMRERRVNESTPLKNRRSPLTAVLPERTILAAVSRSPRDY